MPDLEAAMRKLSTLFDISPYERVYAWRQILDGMWRKGFEEGYSAAMRDRGVADLLAEKEAKEAPLD